MLPEQQQRILGYFIEEAKDHLNTIEQGLMNLQTTIEDPELVQEVYRAAHSIKGGAGMLGINSIQKTAHRLEDCFQLLRDCPVKVDQTLESLFLKVFDTLQELLEQLQGANGLNEVVANDIMSAIEPVFAELKNHLANLLNNTSSPQADIPTVKAQIDRAVATTIKIPANFQNNVLAQLREMLQLFKQADNANSRQELQAVCGKLEQLGQELNLVTWSSIIKASADAIAYTDNSYRVLATVVIKEIKQAQELVVTGRSDEVIVSEQLKALLPVETEEILDFDFDFFAAESDATSYVQPLTSEFSFETQAGHNYTDGVNDSPAQTLPDVFADNNSNLNWQEFISGHDSVPEVTTAKSSSHRDPEVGMAELNSLADLFETEAPELDETWQEEEVIDSLNNSSLVVNGNEQLAMDNEQITTNTDDFSDLLDDLSNLQPSNPTNSSLDDDFLNLFGEDLPEDTLIENQELSNLLATEPQEVHTNGNSVDGSTVPNITEIDDLLGDGFDIENESNAFEQEDLASLFGGEFNWEDYPEQPETVIDSSLATDTTEQISMAPVEEDLFNIPDELNDAELLEFTTTDKQENEELFSDFGEWLTEESENSLDLDIGDRNSSLNEQDDFSNFFDEVVTENKASQLPEEETNNLEVSLELGLNFDENENLNALLGDNGLEGLENFDNLDEEQLTFNDADFSELSLDANTLFELPSDETLQTDTDEDLEGLFITDVEENQNVWELSSPVEASDDLEILLDSEITLETTEDLLPLLTTESSDEDWNIDSDLAFAETEVVQLAESTEDLAALLDTETPEDVAELLTAASDDWNIDSDLAFAETEVVQLAESTEDLAALLDTETAEDVAELLTAASDDWNIDSDLAFAETEVVQLAESTEDLAALLDTETAEDVAELLISVSDEDWNIDSDLAFAETEIVQLSESAEDLAALLDTETPEDVAELLTTESIEDWNIDSDLAFAETEIVQLSESTENLAALLDTETPEDVAELLTTESIEDWNIDSDLAFAETEIVQLSESAEDLAALLDSEISLETPEEVVPDLSTSDASDSEWNFDTDLAFTATEDLQPTEASDDLAVLLDIETAASTDVELDGVEELNEFADLLTEENIPINSQLNVADEFDDLVTLLSEEVAPTTTQIDAVHEFDDLDNLLDQEIISATAQLDTANEFDDLDALLGEQTTPITTQLDTANEFDDLDALLGEQTTPATTQLDAANEFDDLDALLAEEQPVAAGDRNSSVVPAQAAKSVAIGKEAADDGFGELESLLLEADKTIGGPPAAKPSAKPAARMRDQTMRVPVKHLDNLSNLMGELVVNRNTLEQDQERMRQFLDNLLTQVQQLSDVGARMQDLYERSLLESSLLASRQSFNSNNDKPSNTPENVHATGVRWEREEMDLFTPFHTLSQEMIELIVRVRESASDIEFLVDETDQVARMLRQVTTQLQEGLTRARMVPFAQIADQLPRAVREISRKYGKEAELKIEGRDTLIDKVILERLYDPMTHLVNNAIAHGIEMPDVRKAAGKSPIGRIIIRAFHQGNQTVISISDDGAGINPERVKAKALEKKIITPAEAKTMSRNDVYELLFHAGFSTKDSADMIAGKGVGMDVVRTNVAELRGTITTDSTLGKGTTFIIRLPLTLSICKALCCLSNRARVAFPMDGVEDMLDVSKDRVQTNAEGQNYIAWRDTTMQFQPLSELLTYNRQIGRGTIYGGQRDDDKISIVVLRGAGNFIAVEVDQVLGEQEIVIKQLEGPVPKPAGIAGATVLGDGRIMPIADVLELIDISMGRLRKELNMWDKSGEVIPPEPTVKADPMVLIIDDSITVRELLSMTFNKAGYRVEQARDGQEAWDKLRSGLPCNIVFCDIEMPRMDGLELLSRIQKDENLNHLPVAMLTSRGALKHQQLASELGASGYFTKPYLEEALLDAAQRMMKGEKLLNMPSNA